MWLEKGVNSTLPNYQKNQIRFWPGGDERNVMEAHFLYGIEKKVFNLTIYIYI